MLPPFIGFVLGRFGGETSNPPTLRIPYDTPPLPVNDADCGHARRAFTAFRVSGYQNVRESSLNRVYARERASRSGDSTVVSATFDVWGHPSSPRP